MANTAPPTGNGQGKRVTASGREARDTVVKVRGLVSRFDTAVIHDGLDLDLYRGEVLGVVGGSGSGKSVLLRSIIGLIRPAGGKIEVFGREIGRLSPREMRAIEKRWGVLFQDGALFSSLTVAQNIEVPLLEFFDLSPALRAEIIELKIALVGLPADAGPKYPSQLSGGMRKRAGLARALALDPEILFLDEPTAGLDPIGAAAYDQLIGQLQKTLDLTVFMVTHDLDSLAAICDRVAVLAEKRVLCAGTLADMLEEQHPWVREYFHGPRAEILRQVAARE